jgi:hypothetical protein
MYYEEKVIDGVLHRRGNPRDDFKPFTAKQLTEMLREERRKNRAATEALEAEGYGA